MQSKLIKTVAREEVWPTTLTTVYSRLFSFPFLYLLALARSSESGGRLSLVNITSVRKFEGGGNFAFFVHGTDRDLLLRADTENDVSRWVRGLTLQIDLVRGGTFQGPPSAKNRRRTVLRPPGESGMAGFATKQQLLEHKHFREINDRIKAIMECRDDGSGKTRNFGPASQVLAAGRKSGGHEQDVYIDLRFPVDFYRSLFAL